MSNEIRQRLGWIKLYEETQDAGLVCRRCGISRPTLRKWWQRYQTLGEAGLQSQSRRPKNSPGQKVTPEHEQYILALRRVQNLGVRRIQNEMKRLHQVEFGLETIHKVLKKHAVPALQQPVRHRPAKRYQKDTPGERVQMDTCKIVPGLYLYTAVDDCSRYLVVRLYKRRTATNAAHFLREHVLEELGFPIQRLQTDNGSEFTGYGFQDALEAFSIKFRPVRPASPHLNGKVERAQKTVLTEFFAIQDLKAASMEQLNEQLAYWQHYYNWERVHGGIRQPPIEKLQQLLSQTPFWDEVIANYDTHNEQQKRQQRLLKRVARN